MNYHIIEAKYLKDYKIWIKFEDGKNGVLDFSNEFDGPIFLPLKKIEYFKNFKIEGNTLHWENGADFAPEYLYDLLAKKEIVSV